MDLNSNNEYDPRVFAFDVLHILYTMQNNKQRYNYIIDNITLSLARKPFWKDFFFSDKLKANLFKALYLMV